MRSSTLEERIEAMGTVGAEEALSRMVQAFPWMGEHGMILFKQAFAVFLGFLSGQAMDLELAVENLAELARGAKVACDAERARVFDQCYGWSCELLQMGEGEKGELRLVLNILHELMDILEVVLVSRLTSTSGEPRKRTFRFVSL